MGKHTEQLAKHILQVHYGGNWTWSNLEDQLKDVTWEEAIHQLDGFNTIATLTFHIGYFTEAIVHVLEGHALNSNDKFSFDHPPINGNEDWQNLKLKVLNNAEKLAELLKIRNDHELFEIFEEEKYGTYYRNLLGFIEHTHYHLGQIALLKKLVKKQ